MAKIVTQPKQEDLHQVSLDFCPSLFHLKLMFLDIFEKNNKFFAMPIRKFYLFFCKFSNRGNFQFQDDVMCLAVIGKEIFSGAYDGCIKVS